MYIKISRYFIAINFLICSKKIFFIFNKNIKDLNKILENQNPTKNKEDMIKKLREENINESELKMNMYIKEERRHELEKRS